MALQGEKKLCLLITNSAIYAELHCCAKILPRIHCVGELFLPSYFEQTQGNIYKGFKRHLWPFDYLVETDKTSKEFLRF